MGVGRSEKILPPSQLRPRPTNWDSKVLTSTFSHCLVLFVCHEWGPYKRRGAARHVTRSGNPIHVFVSFWICNGYFQNYSKHVEHVCPKTWRAYMRAFHDCLRFVFWTLILMTLWSRNCAQMEPKMTPKSSLMAPLGPHVASKMTLICPK